MKVESIEEKLMRLAEIRSKMRHCHEQWFTKHAQASIEKLASSYKREMAKLNTALEENKESDDGNEI